MIAKHPKSKYGREKFGVFLNGSLGADNRINVPLSLLKDIVVRGSLGFQEAECNELSIHFEV